MIIITTAEACKFAIEDIYENYEKTDVEREVLFALLKNRETLTISILEDIISLTKVNSHLLFPLEGKREEIRQILEKIKLYL